MSLKGFHVLFIVLSIVLAFGFGLWALRAYSADGTGANLGMGLASLTTGATLVGYGIWFIRKIRSTEEEKRRRRKIIHPLVAAVPVCVLASRAAEACAVCYGNAQGPMIDAARMGVWLLFGLVFAVQLGFVLFFIRLRRRAREHERRNPRWAG